MHSRELFQFNQCTSLACQSYAMLETSIVAMRVAKDFIDADYRFCSARHFPDEMLRRSASD